MAHGYVNLTEVTPGSANAWVDVDLSAIIPTGAVVVGLLFVNTAAGTNAVGARPNGSTDNRNAALSGSAWTALHVGVDGSRIVEVYVGHTTNVDVYVFWWADSTAAGFLTNAADKSAITGGVYQDVDISTNTGADTALVAFFEIINAATFGIRCNGATEDPRYSNSNHHGVASTVDGSEICEQLVSSTVCDLFLNAWLKAEFTGYVNALDRSSASTFGSYVDVTALPSGADGGLYRGGAGNFAVALALRTNGASDDFYRDIIRQAYRIVECDASRLIEQKAEDSSVDVFEVGYLTPAVLIAQGVLSAAGVGASTTVGRALAGAALSSAGVGAASSTGRSSAAAAFASSGVAAYANSGRSINAGALSGAGTATVGAVGRSIVNGAWSAAGEASYAAVGRTIAAAAWSGAGAGALSGVGRSLAASVFTSAGSSEAGWTGGDGAGYSTTMAGAATVAFAGRAIVAGAIAASGAGALSATGRSQAQAAWTAAGTGGLGAHGRMRASGAWSGAGAGTAEFTGRTCASGQLAAVGAGTVTALSTGEVAGVLSALGSSMFAAAAGGHRSAAFSAAGVGTFSAALSEAVDEAPAAVIYVRAEDRTVYIPDEDRTVYVRPVHEDA